MLASLATDAQFEESRGLLSADNGRGLSSLQKARLLCSTYVSGLTMSTASAHFQHMVAALAIFLTPSFMFKGPPVQDRPGNKLAVIDGIRGMACLFVFNAHLLESLMNEYVWCGRWNGEIHWFQFPIIRTVMAGRSMVWIFYAISGYTASLKPFKQLSSPHPEAGPFLKSLSSTVIRRPFRLLLPPLAAMLFTATAVHFGLMEPARHMKEDVIHGKQNFYFLVDEVPDRVGSLFGQWWDVMKVSPIMFNLMADITMPGKYDNHLWCISWQFRCALTMAVVHLASWRMKPKYRTLMLCGILATSVFITPQISYLTHFGGMLLADIDIRSATRSTAIALLPELNEKSSTTPARARSYSRMLYGSAVVFALVLMSIAFTNPQDQVIIGSVIRRFPYLFKLFDGRDGVPGIGAIIFIHGVMHCDIFHPIFTSRVLLYFGKISFSMYILHGPMFRIVLFRFLPMIYSVAGTQGPMSDPTLSTMQSLGIYIMAIVLTLPVTVWLSDVFYRLVEVNAGKLEFWVDRNVARED